MRECGQDRVRGNRAANHVEHFLRSESVFRNDAVWQRNPRGRSSAHWNLGLEAWSLLHTEGWP